MPQRTAGRKAVGRSQSAPQPTSGLLQVPSAHPRGVLLFCFFLSGATGLVYEVVWARRLTLTFGATVLAVSTVLAAFLGGLALGALVFGRIADRRRDPVRVYAALEGTIGLVCFLTPWLFGLVEHAYVSLHPNVAGNLWLERLLRFALSGAVLIVPTALMGGTLPVLTRALVRREGDIGRGVASLYGINTLGAVVGAAGAGFVLLPILGLRGTVFQAAVLNLAIAAMAFCVHSVRGEDFAPPDKPDGARARRAAGVAVEPPVTRGALWALLVAYGLSGAAALIYEVAWTRVLSLAFGTSTYAFTATLVAFLAGLALGSLALATRAVGRLRDPLLWFGLAQIGIAASVTFLSPLLDRMPFVFLALHRRIGTHFALLEGAELLVCLGLMLLPTLLMGLTFPLVARLAAEQIGLLGRRLAAVYSANTFGTVIGSFAAGFVLMPWIGVRMTLAVGVALNGAVGLLYVVRSWRRAPKGATVGLVLAAATVTAWAVLPDWNRDVLTSGAYVYPGAYAGRDAQARMEERTLLHYRDALTATVSVCEASYPGMPEPILSLQISGKTDASTSDMSTQLLSAHFPVLLHPGPKSALVVGLASGCTLGALERYDSLERVDCVEIEPEMIAASGFFREYNHACLEDPRLRLFIDDARSFVLTTDARYDVITSEPSNPWIAGVANLFSLEHFRLCRERLNPGGIFCQWVPLYNLAPSDLGCIVKTFRTVFPHNSLWVFPVLPTDAFLVGSAEPLSIDISRLAERLGRGGITEDVVAAGLGDAWDVLGGYLAPAEAIEQRVPNAPLNTDDMPLIEFGAPLRLNSPLVWETTPLVLGLASASSPPIGVCDEPAREGGVRCALAGLRLSAPWSSPSRHEFTALHPVDRYLSQTLKGGQPAVLRIEVALGDSKATIDAWRNGEDPGDRVASVPDGRSRERTEVGGHPGSLWRADDGGWGVEWACERGRRMFRVVVSPGTHADRAAALAAIRCEHGGRP